MRRPCALYRGWRCDANPRNCPVQLCIRRVDRIASEQPAGSGGGPKPPDVFHGLDRDWVLAALVSCGENWSRRSDVECPTRAFDSLKLHRDYQHPAMKRRAAKTQFRFYKGFIMTERIRIDSLPFVLLFAAFPLLGQDAWARAPAPKNRRHRRGIAAVSERSRPGRSRHARGRQRQGIEPRHGRLCRHRGRQADAAGHASSGSRRSRSRSQRRRS